MRWTVHGERAIYESPWVNLCLIDVEQPDGRRWEHHVVRLRDLAAVAVVNDERVLMQWRHRFVTDTWAWELPMGLIEENETPEEAGTREVEEETGWRPGPLTRLTQTEIANGITDSRHYLFRAEGATYAGQPTELNESNWIEWIPLADVRGMMDHGKIVSSASLLGLTYTLLEYKY